MLEATDFLLKLLHRKNRIEISRPRWAVPAHPTFALFNTRKQTKRNIDSSTRSRYAIAIHRKTNITRGNEKLKLQETETNICKCSRWKCVPGFSHTNLKMKFIVKLFWHESIGHRRRQSQTHQKWSNWFYEREERKCGKMLRVWVPCIGLIGIYLRVNSSFISPHQYPSNEWN